MAGAVEVYTVDSRLPKLQLREKMHKHIGGVYLVSVML